MVTDSAGHSPVSRCIDFMRSMIADHEMAIQRHLREIEELESNDAAEFADRTAPFSASHTPNVTNGDTSMNEITTPNAEPATISKKELWELFVANPVRYYSPMGQTLEIYRPDDILRDGGECCDLEDYANRAADEIADEADPEAALEARLEQVEAFANGLKTVLEDFRRVALAHVVYDEDDNGDEDRYRYRHPDDRLGGTP